ncbi:hypothetical protein LY76DRAFT_248896 [Colletotrichum caudatum]|nr:hypothetical protein LY76DRAFT_248896 [Colletotrichum caudatum]
MATKRGRRRFNIALSSNTTAHELSRVMNRRLNRARLIVMLSKSILGWACRHHVRNGVVSLVYVCICMCVYVCVCMCKSHRPRCM